MNVTMPAEWAAREGTIMGWPVREEVWPDGLADARKAFAQVAKIVAEGERLVMVTRPSLAGEVREMCGSRVEIFACEQDDSWLRDNGPTFVYDSDGIRLGVNWDFNAWGEKYKPYSADRKVAERVLAYLGVKRISVPLILEGGSIHSDGEGTILTTGECLLNTNRNPNLSRTEIETFLSDYVGAKKIIWLPRGLYMDETDGHIDNVCCFVAPGEVLLQVRSDRSDPDWDIAQENLEILKNSVDASGRTLKIHTVEAPPVMTYEGDRLCASYVNYYIANVGILMPSFAEGAIKLGQNVGAAAKKSDDAAAELLAKLYPGKKIHRIDGLSIVKGGGNVHCITQQIPKPSLPGH